jgi:putative transposase
MQSINKRGQKSKEGVNSQRKQRKGSKLDIGHSLGYNFLSMARALRIQYPGALYHVTSRGNERKKIYLSKPDYVKFKEYLRDACEKFKVLPHCYVLMGNHYHIVVETPHANLSSFMHYLNGSYTTYVNIKRKRCGHLLQGRYKAVLIDADSYLLEVSRYVHLNPVRAGLAKRPELYPYSSYPAYTGHRDDALVFRDRILSMISNNRRRAPGHYRQFVEEALSKPSSNPFEKLHGGIILGKKEFIRDVLRRIERDTLKDRGIARRKEFTSAPTLGALTEAVTARGRFSEAATRDIVIYLSRKLTSLTNAEIGRHFGDLSYSAVAKAAARFAEKLKENEELRKDVERIEARLTNVKL